MTFDFNGTNGNDNLGGGAGPLSGPVSFQGAGGDDTLTGYNLGNIMYGDLAEPLRAGGSRDVKDWFTSGAVVEIYQETLAGGSNSLTFDGANVVGSEDLFLAPEVYNIFKDLASSGLTDIGSNNLYGDHSLDGLGVRDATGSFNNGSTARNPEITQGETLGFKLGGAVNAAKIGMQLFYADDDGLSRHVDIDGDGVKDNVKYVETAVVTLKQDGAVVLQFTIGADGVIVETTVGDPADWDIKLINDDFEGGDVWGAQNRDIVDNGVRKNGAPILERVQNRGESEIVVKSLKGASFDAIEMTAGDIVAKDEAGNVLEGVAGLKSLVSDFLVRSLEVESFGNDLLIGGSCSDFMLAGQDFGSYAFGKSATVEIGNAIGGFVDLEKTATPADILTDWLTDAAGLGMTIRASWDGGATVQTVADFGDIAAATFISTGATFLQYFNANALPNLWGLGVVNPDAITTIAADNNDPVPGNPEINAHKNDDGEVVADTLEITFKVALHTLTIDLSLFYSSNDLQSIRDDDNQPIRFPNGAVANQEVAKIELLDANGDVAATVFAPAEGTGGFSRTNAGFGSITIDPALLAGGDVFGLRFVGVENFDVTPSDANDYLVKGLQATFREVTVDQGDRIVLGENDGNVDRVIYRVGDGVDVVENFELGIDRLEFDAGATYQTSHVLFEGVASTLIEADADDGAIILKGVTGFTMDDAFVFDGIVTAGGCEGEAFEGEVSFLSYVHRANGAKISDGDGLIGTFKAAKPNGNNGEMVNALDKFEFTAIKAAGDAGTRATQVRFDQGEGIGVSAPDDFHTARNKRIDNGETLRVARLDGEFATKAQVTLRVDETGYGADEEVFILLRSGGDVVGSQAFDLGFAAQASKVNTTLSLESSFAFDTVDIQAINAGSFTFRAISFGGDDLFA